MVEMEVTGTMTKTAPKNWFVQDKENSEWLYDLLAEVRADVTIQPTPAAIRRMRAKLEAGMKRPAEIAA